MWKRLHRKRRWRHESGKLPLKGIAWMRNAKHNRFISIARKVIAEMA